MPAALADIGCMQLGQPTNESVRKFAGHFGRTPDEQVLATFDQHSFMGDLYQAAGFDYISIDIADAPYVFRFDLNNDQVPPSLKGKYDIVMNTGTTEHVLNQLNALKTVHDLAKPGGLIFSLFLINGFGSHGLLRYCNRFVALLAEANRYELISTEIHARTFSQWRQKAGPDAKPDEFIIDQCEWAVFKKTNDAPFSPVVDINDVQDKELDTLLSDRERSGGRPDVRALMAEQKRLAREKDAVISEKEALISEQDARLSEKEALLSQKDMLLAEKDSRLSERDARLSENETLLSHKDMLLAEHKRQLAETHLALDAMRNSRSWRITAPVRKAAGWLRQ